MPRQLLSRIFASFHRRRLEEEFDQEIGAHLELLAERFVRQGMDPAEARNAARRQFGGITQVREEQREQRALPSFDIVIQELRHAFRQLRLAKGLTATAALTLALGIGATTAVFAVLDAVVLRPLPYAQPDRLMALRMMDQGIHPSPISYPNFFDFREQNRVFDHLVCYRGADFTLTGAAPAVQVKGVIGSWDLFELAGVQPQLGRGFRPEEEAAGRDVVVLSHDLWRQRFGGDPAILNRQVSINGRPFTVTGVAPAGFRFPMDLPEVELWTTLAQDARRVQGAPATEQRGAWMVAALGRLKPGATVEQARAQMDQVAEGLAHRYPAQNKSLATTSVIPELERLTGGNRRPLWILLGAVGLVMLMACANVASLLLTRSTHRAREFVVRAAVGASRGALIRQVWMESLALGLAGAAGGLLLAALALKAVVPLAGDTVPRISLSSVDARVLYFCLLAALLTSVLFSVAPAAQLTRANLAQTMKDTQPHVVRGHHHLRSALVCVQIMLGLVLLVGAELLMTGFLSLERRDAGFRTDHLLTFEVSAPAMPDKAAEIAFNGRMMAALEAIPGVKHAAAGSVVPFDTGMSGWFNIEERPLPPGRWPACHFAAVTPEYFDAMGIRLLSGRAFLERDDRNAARVLIVNQAFARKYFPGESVVGKRMETGANMADPPHTWREIVGVVADAKQTALSIEPDPIYYFPYKQLAWSIGTVALRTSVPPRQIESAARVALTNLDSRVAIYDVRTGEDLAWNAISRPRFRMVLMTGFAGIALLLTVVGLYGVLSCSVAMRRREIGVRIALGAKRSTIFGLVFRRAFAVLAAGLALGIAGASAARRLVESMVYGVAPGNGILLIAACGLMTATTIAAACVPAWRAASVDPMETLRSE